MTGTATYVAANNEERELLLIGALSFVVYPISRCSSMLGNFRISPSVFFYCQVQCCDLGSPKDLLRLKKILLNWEYNGLSHLKMMIGYGDNIKYFTWLLLKLLPTDLLAEEHEAKRRKEDDVWLIKALLAFSSDEESK